MNRSKKLIFAVTNDLNYDQRMTRICTSLARAGYHVTLVGRKLPGSRSIVQKPYRQHRLPCLFIKGFGFYAEFNLRLFFYLLFRKSNLICGIDLDTAIPCRMVAGIKAVPFVYDAHELFSEMKEVVNRPGIYKVWKMIERWVMTGLRYGYTVNRFIAGYFEKEYGRKFETIRNLPQKKPLPPQNASLTNRFILYQGAVNEGRCFESLIPAMKYVPAELIICGDGNFMKQAQVLVQQHGLENNITFTGWLQPSKLLHYTEHAYIGVNLIENNGQNNYLSLSNRFFDYIQSALPQICVSYPAYKEVVDQHQCAYLVNQTDSDSIANALQTLLTDDELYNSIRENCIKARDTFNWENEEHKLLSFYDHIFES